MASFTAWPALAFAWWLTFFSPRDMWHNHVMRHKVVVFVAAFGRAVSASHAITSWGVDKARREGVHGRGKGQWLVNLFISWLIY